MRGHGLGGPAETLEQGCEVGLLALALQLLA